MAITQIIATLPAVLNDSETFYEDIAVRNNSLVTVSFPSINTWATQANELAVEINDKAAQVAAQAVDGGYSQTYINANFVGVANVQTITSVKTFSASPIVPNATTALQAMAYGQGVNLTAPQTVGGIKTFSASPIVPTPTAPTQAVNKSYVDSKTNAASETEAGIIELATTAEAQAGTNDAAAITPLKLRNAFNATGTAPIYACRAWVNFNGTGTVAIRASGNVGSITDNGVGLYTVNFTTAMTDINFNTVGGSVLEGNNGAFVNALSMATYLTSSVRIRVANQGAAAFDSISVSVAIFR